MLNIFFLSLSLGYANIFTKNNKIKVKCFFISRYKNKNKK